MGAKFCRQECSQFGGAWQKVGLFNFELRGHSTVENPAKFFVAIVGGIIALGVGKIGVDYLLGTRYVAEITWSVLKLNLVHHDSWWPMYEAMAARFEHSGKGIFETVFFERNIKFQYPPISILPFMVAVKLGINGDMIGELANFISFLSIFGIAACVYQSTIWVLRTYCGQTTHSIQFHLLLVVISVVGTFSFYPIIGGQYIGQIQIIVDLFISLAFVSWLMGQKYFSGAMLALATLIKPQFALFLIWAAIRKDKNLFIGMMIILIPSGLVSLYVFGFKEHLDYLRVLSHMGQHGEVYWINQSINGVLNRLLVDATSLRWNLTSYAPYNVIVHAGTFISTVILILFGLFYRPSRNRVSEGSFPSAVATLELAMMLLICTIASPVAWYHHYGILLPIFFALFLLAIKGVVQIRDRLSVWALVLLSLSYWFIANYFDYADSVIFAEPPTNLLQSYDLLGGFMLLAAIILLGRVGRRKSGEVLASN